MYWVSPGAASKQRHVQAQRKGPFCNAEEKAVQQLQRTILLLLRVCCVCVCWFCSVLVPQCGAPSWGVSAANGPMITGASVLNICGTPKYLLCCHRHVMSGTSREQLVHLVQYQKLEHQRGNCVPTRTTALPLLKGARTLQTASRAHDAPAPLLPGTRHNALYTAMALTGTSMTSSSVQVCLKLHWPPGACPHPSARPSLIGKNPHPWEGMQGVHRLCTQDRPITSGPFHKFLFFFLSPQLGSCKF